MGDDADAARDGWYALSWREQREALAEIDEYEQDTRWHARAGDHPHPEVHNMIHNGKTPEMLQAELAAAQAQLALMQAQLAAPSRWPAEPPVGTVIRFERTFRVAERVYTYLAMRVPGVDRPWYVTGERGRERYDWDGLCAMIGDTARCEIATGWFEVPAFEAPEPAPEGDVAAFVDLFDQPRGVSRGAVRSASDPGVEVDERDGFTPG